MPTKRYIVWLDGDTYIVVNFQSVQGKVTSFVVRLMYIRDGVDTDLARYDTAHGRPHLDVVSPSGRLRQKDWLDDPSFDNALTSAINDFKSNYEKFRVAQIGKRLPEI